MADNQTVDNPANGDYTVSADEAASGKVQRVKLTYSADGVDTHVSADANGLLVNTGLGKAEDAVAASGDVGVMALAVRADTAAATGANGDYVPLIVDSTGKLHVNVGAQVPGTGATNLGKAEDAVHASGDTGVFVLGVSASSATVYGASGDYTPFSVDTAGRLRVHGAAAQDAAVGGDVVLVGGRASAAVPTAMSADGDAVFSYMDRSGRQVVAQKSGTATSSNVAGSATSVTLLAANTSRLGATFYNDSTAILYLKLGATASTTSFTAKLFPEDYFEVPFGYTGVVDGIWASATGSARVVELT